MATSTNRVRATATDYQAVTTDQTFVRLWKSNVGYPVRIIITDGGLPAAEAADYVLWDRDDVPFEATLAAGDIAYIRADGPDTDVDVVAGDDLGGTDSEGRLTVEAGLIGLPTATQFARPADTTAYSSGDLVANSTTAASVAPLQFTVPREAGRGAYVTGCRLKKSTTTVANASFRLHLFRAAPSVATDGDNSAFASNVSGAANYIGAIDVLDMLALADGAVGSGAPRVGTMRPILLPSGTTVYGLLEARAAYAPGNAETFDVMLETIRE